MDQSANLGANIHLPSQQTSFHFLYIFREIAYYYVTLLWPSLM